MKRNYFIILIALVILSACSKMSHELVSSNSDTHIENQTQTLKSFAQILSKALYNEPELRCFIKEEALKRRNLDYEVFYHWVKDVKVHDSSLFGEIIRKYDSNNELDGILNANPLLTILVPDWSWVHTDCFSPKTWLTESPDVGVSYTSNDSYHEIFHNGKYAFSMQDGEYSTAPILIVKNNERISYNGVTKSGESIYSFDANDYIDLHADVQTKESSTYETINLDYETTSNTIAAIQLYGRARSAYGQTNGTDIPQRDYIYYGLTPSINEGSLNRNFYENLYKIKISPTAKGVFDDPLYETSTSTDFKADSIHIVGRKDTLTTDEMVAASWGEGSIELSITVYTGGIPLVKMCSVPFDVAFDVKQIELRTNINWLGAVKSRTYYLVIPRDLDASDVLVSRWIPINLDLFNWDISKYPTDYVVDFTECDSATSVTTNRTFSHSYTYMTNYTADASDPAGIIKRGYSSGTSITEKRDYVYTETSTQANDHMGNFIIEYADNIVLSQTNSAATLKTYNTGYIQAMIYSRYE